MPWNKLFIKAVIKKKENLYLAEITWSWYGVMHWIEIELFKTLTEANEWVLKQRVDGKLSYE